MGPHLRCKLFDTQIILLEKDLIENDEVLLILKEKQYKKKILIIQGVNEQDEETQKLSCLH